jgi:hypothetical protein
MKKSSIISIIILVCALLMIAAAINVYHFPKVKIDSGSATFDGTLTVSGAVNATNATWVGLSANVTGTAANATHATNADLATSAIAASSANALAVNAPLYGGSVNMVVCWKAANILGYCSSNVTAGNCTCN